MVVQWIKNINKLRSENWTVVVSCGLYYLLEPSFKRNRPLLLHFTFPDIASPSTACPDGTVHHALLIQHQDSVGRIPNENAISAA